MPKICVFLMVFAFLLQSANGREKEALEFTLASNQSISPIVDVNDEPISADRVNLTVPQLHAVAAREIDDYQQMIIDIENDQGVYGKDLSQVLRALGISYQRIGRHGKSISTFKRAMHVNRINEGLYSLNQLPILKDLIESYSQRSEWSKVDNKYRHLHWIYQQNYGKNEMKLLPAIYALAEWHLLAYKHELHSPLGYHLMSAIKLFRQASDIIETHHGKDSPLHVKALMAQLKCHSLFSTFKGNLNIEYRVTNSNASAPQQIESSMDQLAQSVAYEIRTSYRSGKAAIMRLTELVENNPQATDWDKTTAKLLLADWFLFYDKRIPALNKYADIYNSIAQQTSDANELSSVFGKPVILPDRNMFDLISMRTTQPQSTDAIKPAETVAASESPAPVEIEPAVSHFVDINTRDMALTLARVDKEEKRKSAKNYVVASFDVNKYGNTRNVKILDYKPGEGSPMRSNILKSIRGTTFRPRFENSAPVTTKDMKFKFVIPADDT